MDRQLRSSNKSKCGGRLLVREILWTECKRQQVCKNGALVGAVIVNKENLEVLPEFVHKLSVQVRKINGVNDAAC